MGAWHSTALILQKDLSRLKGPLGRGGRPCNNFWHIKMYLTLARMSIFLLLLWFSLFTSFSVLLIWLNRQHLQCVVPCDLTTVSESAASKLHTDTILKTIVKTTIVLSFFLLILHFTVNLGTVDLRAHKELDLAHQ